MADPILIASQLGATRDDAVRRLAADLPVIVESIPRGPVASLPAGTKILFAAPFQNAGESPAARAPGWPLDLDYVQLIAAGLDVYPDWLFDAPLVAHAGGMMAAPMAEYCLAMIFAAAKRVPDVWIHRPEDWRLQRLPSIESATLGLFGFGPIAEQLAARAMALGMRIHVARRSSSALPTGIVRASGIEELMAISDHLVLAAPATDETRHVVSRHTLSLAKPGLHLINVARGSLVDQEALLEALDTGRIALASLDVAEPEPLPAGHPLYTHPKVRLSPHTSALSEDSDERIAAFFVANLRRFLSGEPVINRVG